MGMAGDSFGSGARLPRMGQATPWTVAGPLEMSREPLPGKGEPLSEGSFMPPDGSFAPPGQSQVPSGEEDAPDLDLH